MTMRMCMPPDVPCSLLHAPISAFAMDRQALEAVGTLPWPAQPALTRIAVKIGVPSSPTSISM
ncbi:MAG: hypothetical protein M5R40_06725 [Anaerolineae bacterium]|nr:hypothetical protein [Anaerolineae bacterium]